LVCPACRGHLSEGTAGEGLGCARCGRGYPIVAGLLDLRLESDRYLDLAAERAKAERLASIAESTDVLGLSSAYYAMTDDADGRRDRFMTHIAGAESRGEALAKRLPRRGRILEVGCGTGGLLVAAARKGIAISGVDIASRWLVAARRRLADRGLSVPLLAASADRLPWPDGHFDAVVADSVLEHLDDPTPALREWARVLRPGGRLVAWSPNRFTLTTDPHLGLWGLGWLPRRWLPAYLRLRGRRCWPPRTLSAGSARRLAAAAGLVSIRVDAPEIAAGWARTRPRSERVAIRAYATARRLPGARDLLRAVGPIWELTAKKKETPLPSPPAGGCHGLSSTRA
jgi:SAM-dependent methyltransferase